MTTNETKSLIGSKRLLHAGNVEETSVTIRDVKASYGVVRALVENDLNKKTAWKNLDTLKLAT